MTSKNRDMFSFFRKKAIVDKHTQDKVVACITNAEKLTSGEIRVFIEHKCNKADAILRAEEVFTELKMQHTEGRNAILIYVAFTDRKFALYGDKVIYEKAGGALFWADAAKKLEGHLRKNEICEGLCNCINELGTALAEHFPIDPTIKKNELPDEIAFGK